MNLFKKMLSWKKIGNATVVPISLKVTIILAFFLILTDIYSSFFGFNFYRHLFIEYVKKALKNSSDNIYYRNNVDYVSHSFSNQKENIFDYSTLKQNAKATLSEEKFSAFGVSVNDSKLLFTTANIQRKLFTDSVAFHLMIDNLNRGLLQGFFSFMYTEQNYYGYYRYSSHWNAFFITAVNMGNLNERLHNIFFTIIFTTLGITVFFIFLGWISFKYIFRYLAFFTDSLGTMVSKKRVRVINVAGSGNDEISFLGVVFNSVVHNINSLMDIFKKFTTMDVVVKAYKEGKVELTGENRNLVSLFADICNFATITETLKIDVVKLLNIYYKRVLKEVSIQHGIIGSMIGDGFLGIFGVLNTHLNYNKAYAALRASFNIQKAALFLKRDLLIAIEKIEDKIPASEREKLELLLFNIGIGLDMGDVFYGNIGSENRLATTVIGDSVNTASRFESLTRLYDVPIICSQNIKDEVEASNTANNNSIYFLEIDNIYVKGKTDSKRIFWPMEKYIINEDLEEKITEFEKGMEEYYNSNWAKAKIYFENSMLSPAKVLIERIDNNTIPMNWDGKWIMNQK